MNFYLGKIPILSQVVGCKVDFMTHVGQSLEPEVHADGCAPGLEKGLGSDHKNFHDGLKSMSVFLGFSLDDFTYEIDLFIRRFVIGAGYDFSQKPQRDELESYDDKENGEEEQRATTDPL